jgi:DNA-directed RNA polymerase specialized sigma24 family protein
MKQNLASWREDELLALVRARNHDQEAAEAAWVELYKRHVRFVYRQVQEAGSLLGRPLGTEDIVERVFQRVWFGAADRFQPGEYQDADDARRHVLAWLGRIATREFQQSLASRGSEYLSARDPTNLLKLESRSRPIETSNEAARIKTVAEEVLSGDELEIVRLKMQNYDRHTGDSRVSPDDLTAICTRQGITKEVFRKRYERALAKIEAAFSCLKSASQND